MSSVTYIFDCFCNLITVVMMTECIHTVQIKKVKIEIKFLHIVHTYLYTKVILNEIKKNAHNFISVDDHSAFNKAKKQNIACVMIL